MNGILRVYLRLDGDSYYSERLQNILLFHEKMIFMPFKSKLVKVLTFFFPILLCNRMSDTIDYFLLAFDIKKESFQFLTSKKQFKKLA